MRPIFGYGEEGVWGGGGGGGRLREVARYRWSGWGGEDRVRTIVSGLDLGKTRKRGERLTGLRVKRSGAQEQPSVILNLNRLSCLFQPWPVYRLHGSCKRKQVESPKLAVAAVSRSSREPWAGNSPKPCLGDGVRLLHSRIVALMAWRASESGGRVCRDGEGGHELRSLRRTRLSVGGLRGVS